MENVAKMTTKGQITVPRAFREAMGISAGDSIVFRKHGDTIVLSPQRKRSVFEEFRGSGTPGIGPGKRAVLRWVREVRGDV